MDPHSEGRGSDAVTAAETAIHRLVARLRGEPPPSMVCRTRSGWVVLGEPQVVSGYCLLLPDPVVPRLNDLHGRARSRFLADMVGIGDALLRVTDAVRINYEILGNLEPALHAHILPRRRSEPPELQTKPIWFFDWAAAPPLESDQGFEQGFERLKRAIATELVRAGVAVEQQDNRE